MSETIAVVSLDPTGEGNKVLQHITEEFKVRVLWELRPLFEEI